MTRPLIGKPAPTSGGIMYFAPSKTRKLDRRTLESCFGPWRSVAANLLAQHAIPPHQRTGDRQNRRSESQRGPKHFGRRVESPKAQANNPNTQFTVQKEIEHARE